MADTSHVVLTVKHGSSSVYPRGTCAALVVIANDFKLPLFGLKINSPEMRLNLFIKLLIE